MHLHTNTAQTSAEPHHRKQYLNSRQVRARYGNISSMTLWRWEKQLGFPRGVKINKRLYRSEAELDAWDAAQASA